ncbi:hypothetical protein NQ318_018301 [Aromia moschata]|uniref:CWH43-like N-terminal domain-containing protein n=1 Tax=Aromia moschata TaxID=1265417 RepID=A0AAV8ZD94_9CUCU|nr:hypothetical protein NQ318_018301 [Aromia moschata]
MTHSYLKFKLYYFPMLTAVWYTVTYLLVYTMAVLEGHVNPIFPFISAAGTTPPESCIFGFMLNIGAVLMFIVIYVRYQYIRYSNEVDVPKRLNNFTYFLGMSASFGVILVANFQETNLLPVHVLGASCAFGSSVIYCCIQYNGEYFQQHEGTAMGNSLSPFIANLFMSKFETEVKDKFEYFPRVWFSSVALDNNRFPTLKFTYEVEHNEQLPFLDVLLEIVKINMDNLEIYSQVFIPELFELFILEYGVDRFKWKLEDGGYSFHLAATFSEWITALSLNIYIFTFASDFKDIRFEGVVFTKDVELKL